MKKIIKYTLIIIFSLSILISSCHKRIEIDTKYDSFNRVVGPEGDTINFYEYNPIDSISEVIVKLEIPEGALTEYIVFNMYEFYNDALWFDLYYIGMNQYSDFLYFVPFYESYGYNEHTGNSLEDHLSVEFNTSATVTYNFRDSIDNNAKLYRIKIPKMNEWGDETSDNIYVNWNYQGYPEGYYALDLQYIINSQWTEHDAYGTGELSFDHWEEVIDYNIINEKVTFEIQDTDYMYVMSGISEE